MKKRIGKMERLRNSINEIRNEKIDESGVDELCEILNEENLEVENDNDDEGLAASSMIVNEMLHRGQVSEAKVSRIH